MFKTMRRKKQLLTHDAAEGVLARGLTGVLGVLGDDGYPYTVPLNYVYSDGAIYFHCAKAGHKLDAIRSHDKVSFCVVDKEDVVAEELTTYFRSAIAFGRAAELTDGDARRNAMRLLNEKYAPGRAEAGERAVENDWDVLGVVKIQIEHLTGKEAIELVKPAT